MNTVLDVVEQVMLMAPVPYLQPAVQSFKIIWSRIGQAKSNKRQIQTIAQTVAEILLALNSQAVSNNPPEKREEDTWIKENRMKFEQLLSDIAEFCIRVTKKRFIKSFLDSAADQDQIDSIHTGLKSAVDVFQIGTQVNIQNYNKQIEIARQEDQAEINAALKHLLEKQVTLLTLVGEPGADIMPPRYNDTNEGGEKKAPPETQTTIFGLLGDIQDSVKQVASSPERDKTLQEFLIELRKVAEPPRPPSIDPHPILAHLKPGLKPEVLIAPLQHHMRQYTWDSGIAYCLTSKQCYDFEKGLDSSKLFIEYLMSCDDRALHYASLEAFRKDKTVKHFFKKKDLYAPTDNPNPLLANLKPGLRLSVVTPPLQYRMRDFTWKGSIAGLLTSKQNGSFFCSGAEGCKRFIDHLQENADVALQYATLEAFREDKRVNFYFLVAPEEESE